MDDRGDDAFLPIDPDVETEQTQSGLRRPVHLRPAYLGIVVLGGAVGTGLREALSLVFPPIDGVPYVILAINVLGAFFLGVLLESLVRRGPDVGHRRVIRLLVGTGMMGGFTTYSALAVSTASLLGDGTVGVGIAYGLLTVVVGALASWAGIALASSRHRGRTQ